MTGNPVSYAEQVLAVHTVWDEALQRESKLSAALHERAEGVTAIRRLKSEIADRERDLTSDLTASAPANLKATERTALVKEGLQKDARLSDLRSELDDLQATQDMLDADVRLHEKGLDVLAARMTQLGGLLTFYAAARMASHTTPRESETTKL